MTNSPRVKVKPSGAFSQHDVYLDGELVGSIVKRRQTYNLRRFFVSEWYEIRLKEGRVRDRYGNPTQYELLRDARADVEAILLGERTLWPAPEAN